MCYESLVLVFCSVKRIAQESPVVHVDDAAERSQRQICGPSTVANFRKPVVGILQETPELASPGDFTAGVVLVMVEGECVAEQNLFRIPGIIHLAVTRLRQSGSSFGLRKRLS